MSQNNQKDDPGNYPDQLEGVFTIGKNELGYVFNKTYDVVISIPSHKQNTALHKDRVAVTITDREQKKGEITEIKKRAKSGFAGTLKQKGDHYVLDVSNNKYPEIIIPEKAVDDETKDKKVFVTIDHWNDAGPVGTIEKVLGDSGDNEVEMQAIALEQGFDSSFPDDVELEAKKLEERGVTDEDMEGRKDMRDVLTFTIDPEDAKDFDDALSLEEHDDGTYTIGIHIADVAHYVERGSAIDEEAQERTTSVYLVDRTIPMLPEALSNNLCSLRPDEEKLAFSAVFTVDGEGNIQDEWFGRTIIRSDKRFSYVEAQESIDTGEGEFAGPLQTLNNIAHNYTKQRFAEGALNLETDEVVFRLDEEGVPIKIEKKKHIQTNRLIEEYMLLANKRVAKFMADKTKQSIFIYRVHDKPDPEKMRDLWHYLKNLGYDVPYKNGVIPSVELNALLREVDNSETRDAIQTSIIRSLAKAVYTTENIGHYGLGFEYYTHFTSPIRRYPDVMVHRLLAKCLNNEHISREDFEFYQRLTQRSSEREQEAQQAEWDSIKYKQVEYMSERIGEVYEASISGVSKHGLFVREKETLAEGLIHISNMGDEYFEFKEENMKIVGQKSKKTYSIGDTVTVKVTNTDLEHRQIDYALLSNE